MAQPYLDQLQRLVASIAHDDADLVCKHFFSGAALYANGKICASLTPVGLAFKLPQSRCDTIIEKGKAKSLKYFDRSPTKRGYILLPTRQNLSDADVASYFGECLAYAGAPDA